jgi:hypothetical protein
MLSLLMFYYFSLFCLSYLQICYHYISHNEGKKRNLLLNEQVKREELNEQVKLQELNEQVKVEEEKEKAEKKRKLALQQESDFQEFLADISHPDYVCHIGPSKIL